MGVKIYGAFFEIPSVVDLKVFMSNKTGEDDSECVDVGIKIDGVEKQFTFDEFMERLGFTND